MSKNLIIGIVAVLLLAGGALYLLKKPNAISPIPIIQNQPKSSVTQFTSGAQGTKPAAIAQIMGVQMSTGLTTGGAALKPSVVFPPTAPILYAVLSLKNAVQRTQLSYIRYYEGKYVDSKVSHPSVNGAKYFHFDWALHAGKTRKVGNYSLTFYIDGKKAQTISYSIR